MTIEKKSGVGVTQAFARALVKDQDTPKVLHLNETSFSVFGKIEGHNTIQVLHAQEIPQNLKFDIILGDHSYWNGYWYLGRSGN